MPDDVSDEDASWFALAAIAQHGLAQSRLEPGDTVAVVGAGVLGQLVAQLARAAGAGEVIVIARSRPRLDAAAGHGATAVAASAAEASDAVLSRTNGEGASIVFDVTGNEAVLADAMKLARRGGTIVLLGDVGDPGGQRLGPELLLADLHVVGAHIANVSTSERRRMAEEFFAAVGDGRVVVGDLITQPGPPRGRSGCVRLAGGRRSRPSRGSFRLATRRALRGCRQPW